MDDLYMTDDRHIVLITHAEDEEYEEDKGCAGHETLRGDLMGESFYCDGTCISY